MRALAQRVRSAAVSVGGERVAETGPGLAVYACAMEGDGEQSARAMASKVAALRVFGEGRMDRSLADTGGECMVVSQFTLAADTRRGNRPSFTQAMEPGRAEELVGVLAAELAAKGVTVRTGAFGEHMEVSLECDGPVTIWLETR